MILKQRALLLSEGEEKQAFSIRKMMLTVHVYSMCVLFKKEISTAKSIPTKEFCTTLLTSVVFYTLWLLPRILCFGFPLDFSLMAHNDHISSFALFSSQVMLRGAAKESLYMKGQPDHLKHNWSIVGYLVPTIRGVVGVVLVTTDITAFIRFVYEPFAARFVICNFQPI